MPTGKIVVEGARVLLELGGDVAHRVADLLLVRVAPGLRSRAQHGDPIGGGPAKVEFHVVVGLEQVGRARLAERLDLGGLLEPEIAREEKFPPGIGLDVGIDPIPLETLLQHRVGGARPHIVLVFLDLVDHVAIRDLYALAVAVLPE